MTYEDCLALTRQIRHMSNVQKILELLLFITFMYLLFVPSIFLGLVSQKESVALLGVLWEQFQIILYRWNHFQ